MLYTPMTKAALRLCFKAHEGQRDRCGLPYANHPLHLAEQMETEDETCAALLHDTMEDCGLGPDDLRAAGISERAVEAVCLLTHKEGVPYLDYVRALAGDPVARRVKIADLRHNSELARLDEVGPKDIARLRKYMEARVVLGDMAYSLQTPAGPVAAEAAGEPYPFVVEPCPFGEEPIPLTEEPHRFGGEQPGHASGGSSRFKEYLLTIDLLPLKPGDEVRFATRLENGGRACELHVQERRLELEPGCCARHGRAPMSYVVEGDPVESRYYPREHTVWMRVSWFDKLA